LTPNDGQGGEGSGKNNAPDLSETAGAGASLCDGLMGISRLPRRCKFRFQPPLGQLQTAWTVALDRRVDALDWPVGPLGNHGATAVRPNL